MNGKWVDYSIVGTYDTIVAMAKAKGIKCPTKDLYYPHLIFMGNRIDGFTGRRDNYYTQVPLSEFIKFIEDYEPPIMLDGHKVEFTTEFVNVGCTTLTNEEVDAFIVEYNKFHGKS